MREEPLYSRLAIGLWRLATGDWRTGIVIGDSRLAISNHPAAPKFTRASTKMGAIEVANSAWRFAAGDCDWRPATGDRRVVTRVQGLALGDQGSAIRDWRSATIRPHRTLLADAMQRAIAAERAGCSRKPNRGTTKTQSSKSQTVDGESPAECP